MIPTAFCDLTVRGDLQKRMYANLNRLEEAHYQPDAVFKTSEQNGGWDGDTEGRTILALTLEAQAAHRTPKYLAEILARLPQKLNAGGYFGPVYPGGVFCEQQLASHGWVLRALCELYAWKGEARILALVRTIIHNLALPGAGYYARYPIQPEIRVGGGSFSGTHQNQVGEWLLSSDTGCVFIFLDGCRNLCPPIRRTGRR